MAVPMLEQELEMVNATGMHVLFWDNGGAKPRAGIITEGLVRADGGLPVFDGTGYVQISVLLPPTANEDRPDRHLIQVSKPVKHRLDPTREPQRADPGDVRFWDYTPFAKALMALGLGMEDAEAGAHELLARLENAEAIAKALATRLEKDQIQIKELRAKLKDLANEIALRPVAAPEPQPVLAEG